MASVFRLTAISVNGNPVPIDTMTLTLPAVKMTTKEVKHVYTKRKVVIGIEPLNPKITVKDWSERHVNFFGLCSGSTATIIFSGLMMDDCEKVNYSGELHVELIGTPETKLEVDTIEQELILGNVHQYELKINGKEKQYHIPAKAIHRINGVDIFA